MERGGIFFFCSAVLHPLTSGSGGRNNLDILYFIPFIFSPLAAHRPLSTPEQMEREVALRQKIEHLKRNKAAICLPKSSSAVENETGTTAKDRTWGPDGKKEKTSLLYEFISIRVRPSGFSIHSTNTLQQQMAFVKVRSFWTMLNFSNGFRDEE